MSPDCLAAVVVAAAAAAAATPTVVVAAAATVVAVATAAPVVAAATAAETVAVGGGGGGGGGAGGGGNSYSRRRISSSSSNSSSSSSGSSSSNSSSSRSSWREGGGRAVGGGSSSCRRRRSSSSRSSSSSSSSSSNSSSSRSNWPSCHYCKSMTVAVTFFFFFFFFYLPSLSLLLLLFPLPYYLRPYHPHDLTYHQTLQIVQQIIHRPTGTTKAGKFYENKRAVQLSHKGARHTNASFPELAPPHDVVKGITQTMTDISVYVLQPCADSSGYSVPGCCLFCQQPLAGVIYTHLSAVPQDRSVLQPTFAGTKLTFINVGEEPTTRTKTLLGCRARSSPSFSEQFFYYVSYAIHLVKYDLT